MKRAAEAMGGTCTWPSTESEKQDAKYLKNLRLRLITQEDFHRIHLHPWPREQLNGVFEKISESTTIEHLAIGPGHGLGRNRIPSWLPLDLVDAARQNPHIIRLELTNIECIVPSLPALRSLLRQTKILRQLSLSFDDESPYEIESKDAKMLAKALGINTSLKKLSVKNLDTVLFQEMAKFSQHNLDTIEFEYCPWNEVQLSALFALIGSKHASFKDVILGWITSSASDTEQFTNTLVECSTIVNLSLKECDFEINSSQEHKIFQKWKRALQSMPSLHQITLTPYGETFPNILASLPMRVLKFEDTDMDMEEDGQEEMVDLAIKVLANNLIEQYEATPLTLSTEAIVLHTLELSKTRLASCFDHILRILVSPNCLLQKLKLDRCDLNEDCATKLAKHLKKMNPCSLCRDIKISFHVVDEADAVEAFGKLLRGLRRSKILETFELLESGNYATNSYACFSESFPYCEEVKFYCLRNRINRTVQEAGEERYSAADLWFETINAIWSPDNPALATISATYLLLQTKNTFLTGLIHHLQQEKQTS